jgi:hypothetical protein
VLKKQKVIKMDVTKQNLTMLTKKQTKYNDVKQKIRDIITNTKLNNREHLYTLVLSELSPTQQTELTKKQTIKYNDAKTKTTKTTTRTQLQQLVNAVIGEMRKQK